MDDNLRSLMQKAKEMQAGMQKAQEELAKMEVSGTAGAGMVTVRMNGRYYVTGVTIEQSLLSGNKKVLEDLVMAAINDAVGKVEDGSRQKVADLTKSLQLPEGFGKLEEDGTDN
ncbi:MAG: hypothetical protein K0R12_182 [Gammaproteobacteria bacterium]|jgi:DNA-binding YbaB/EbfC family protein|nr:hypothetical protein [Gammaproteobacteria bacterium]